MLIFSVNTNYELWNTAEREKIEQYAIHLRESFPHIASVYLLENTGRADIVTGNPLLLLGNPSIRETLLGKTFEIQP